VQLRDGFAHLESMIQTEVGASAAAPAAIPADGTSTFEVVELDDASAPLDDAPATGLDGEGLVIEEIAAPAAVDAPAPAAPAPAAEPAAPPEGLLVLDTHDGWVAAARGALVTVLAPDATPDAGLRPERVLVNLGAPNALTAFAALRAAGIAAPGFGCIAVPGQPRGLLIGRLELASRPIDPDALLADLPGTFNRGTRVVTAGADVDGLISLRQALARLGVSVSMAWDAKQAGDLLAMVRPEVAIIDLELPPKDGCALVARMALVQPAPLTVVIPKATDTATNFTLAIAHPELGRTTVVTQELVSRTFAIPLKKPAPAKK
jgi:CheY-like chemotaxis protein